GGRGGQVCLGIGAGPDTHRGHGPCGLGRKAQGLSFGIWMDFPAGDFRFTSGEQEVARYRSSPDATRAFCRNCGSSLIWQRDGAPVLSIAAGVLDGDPGCRPALHIFVASRAPWVTPEPGLLQYEASRPT